MVMAFNAPLNNISVISWRSVLLVEELDFPYHHVDWWSRLIIGFFLCVEITIITRSCKKTQQQQNKCIKERKETGKRELD
jgi:hypothetical protein